MPAMRPLLAQVFPTIFTVPANSRAAHYINNHAGSSKETPLVKTTVAGNSRSYNSADQEIGQELDGGVIMVEDDGSQMNLIGVVRH
jgi:hypothetical protein